MDLFEQLERARAEFGARLRQVGEDDWARPTPCDEWDVRALVNHVVGGALRYTMLLDGATADDVRATTVLDHLGADAVASFERRAREVAAAFREPGALARTVHHPNGDITGERLLELRITEFAVHGWDLARAIGADEALDAALVEAMLARAGTPESPDGVPPLARLLRLTGRRP